MATTTWIEITDTAIKIGLGALIAGLFSILLIFATLFRDTYADRRARRLKHIEDAMLSTERYFNFVIKHAANAAWFHSTDLDDAKRRQAKKDFDQTNSRWDDSVDDINTATSRLMLAGFERISEKLRQASALAYKRFAELEDRHIYEKQLKTFETFKSEIIEKRREIMRMLRRAYQR